MMLKTRADDNTGKLLQISAWLAIVWERLWPLLVPLFIALLILATFSWIGGWRFIQSFLEGILHLPLRLLFAGLILACFIPLRQFRLPDQSDILRRIEIRSHLPHRPITAQSDKLKLGDRDSFAKALWVEHQRRMANSLEDLTAGSTTPDANRFDPYVFRAVAGLIAVAAFLYSYSPFGGRLGDIFSLRETEVSIQTRMDAWISPPAYTRKRPIYLTGSGAGNPEISGDADGIQVPVGSEFYLRLINDPGSQLEFVAKSQTHRLIGKGDIESQPAGGLETEFTLKLDEPGEVRLLNKDAVIASWNIQTIDDQPPGIAFDKLPSAALSGALQFSYQLEDDYGVVEAFAEIQSLESPDPNARPLLDPPKLDLPLPRLRARSGKSQVNRDLTEHPWAGSRVVIVLRARDDANQTGHSEPFEMILPSRQFTNPLARALIEQRRILAMDGNRRTDVANLLDATLFAPDDFIEQAGVYITLNATYRKIVSARTDDDLRDSLELLWNVALAVEFGDLNELERQLRDAQEALSKALEKGASDQEIDRLMKELRQAMNELMKSLAEEARRNPQDQNPFSPHDQSQVLTQSDLQRMMEQIENLAKSGSKDAARQMLSELQRMMDNLRAGRHQQQRRAEGDEANQAMDKLGQLMQRQQELMDQTFKMQRRRPGDAGDPNRQNSDRNNQTGDQRPPTSSEQQSQSGQQSGDPNSGSGQMTPEEFAEALERLQQQQQALEQQLSELNKQLEELGMDPSSELGEAQGKMGEAGENLGEGDTGSAASNQGQALEALRQGAQSMMRQMAGDRQQGGAQADDRNGSGNRNRNDGTDPLGRNSGGDALDADSNTRIPGEIDAQRARQILEAIRKRLEMPQRPLIEKEYLERLLQTR